MAVGAPIRRENLGDTVHRILWDRILERQLAAGEKLSDVQLSQQLGVSRTPVREALQRLVQEGVVRIEPNHGFYVVSLQTSELEEIYEVRAALECLAVQLAAGRFSSGELESELVLLDKVELRLKTASTESTRAVARMEFLDVDRGFHRLIVKRAGNRRLEAMIESLWAQIAVLQHAGAQLGWGTLAIERHRGIIWALLAGDGPTASDLMHRHIHEVKRLLLADRAANASVQPPSADPDSVASLAQTKQENAA